MIGSGLRRQLESFLPCPQALGLCHPLRPRGQRREAPAEGPAISCRTGAAYTCLEAATGRALLRQHMDVTGEEHSLNKLRVKIEPGGVPDPMELAHLELLPGEGGPRVLWAPSGPA